MDRYAVVIGAANTDIGGIPYSGLVYGDSNPGHISISCGGVGRNIAHCLASLGVPVSLAAALGDDMPGRYISEKCSLAGIDMSASLVVPGGSSSMYIYINEEDGDMALALSYVDIAQKITPEYIDSLSGLISGASAVVADCNLSSETVLHIIETSPVPVYVDPVSQAHAHKIFGRLAGIDTLKPNRLEAEFLTGMTIRSEADYRAAARELIAQGVRRVFISMGEKGLLAADTEDCCIVESRPCEVVSTTGAGDAAMAAIVWSTLNGCGLEDCARLANSAASIALSSSETVSPDLSPELVIKLAGLDK